MSAIERFVESRLAELKGEVDRLRAELAECRAAREVADQGWQSALDANVASIEKDRDAWKSRALMGERAAQEDWARRTKASPPVPAADARSPTPGGRVRHRATGRRGTVIARHDPDPSPLGFTVALDDGGFGGPYAPGELEPDAAAQEGTDEGRD